MSTSDASLHSVHYNQVDELHCLITKWYITNVQEYLAIDVHTEPNEPVVELTLLNASNVWTHTLRVNDLHTTLTGFDQTERFEITRVALTGKDYIVDKDIPELKGKNVSLFLEDLGGPSKLLTWKASDESSALQTTVHKVFFNSPEPTTTDSHFNVIQDLVQTRYNIKALLKTKDEQVADLQSQTETAITKLGTFTDESKTLVQNLYADFADVLNSKKQKLRALSRALEISETKRKELAERVKKLEEMKEEVEGEEEGEGDDEMDVDDENVDGVDNEEEHGEEEAEEEEVQPKRRGRPKSTSTSTTKRAAPARKKRSVVMELEEQREEQSDEDVMEEVVATQADPFTRPAKLLPPVSRPQPIATTTTGSSSTQPPRQSQASQRSITASIFGVSDDDDDDDEDDEEFETLGSFISKSQKK